MNKTLKHTFILLFLAAGLFLSINLFPRQIRVLFQDDFKSDKNWTFWNGNWKTGKNGLVQYDQKKWNTNCFTRLKQSGTLYFEWGVTMQSGILDSGLHIFASMGNLSERGSSYLIWQFKDGFVIYKSIRNRLKEKIRFKSETVKNINYKCRVKYNPSLGMITIWQDNKFIGSWTDIKPIKEGQYISFRTNKTCSTFSMIRIYRYIK